MKIIHFADLHLGIETYGSVEPVTGRSPRLVLEVEQKIGSLEVGR